MENVDYEEYKRRARIVESSGNDRAVSAANAKGRYQFLASTWKDLGMGGKDIYDPIHQEEAMKRFTQNNIDQFRRKYKREPDYADVYGMHHLGFTGYTRTIDDPNAPVSKYYNEEALAANPHFLKYGTMGNLRNYFANKMNGSTTEGFQYSHSRHEQTENYLPENAFQMEGRSANQVYPIDGRYTKEEKEAEDNLSKKNEAKIRLLEQEIANNPTNPYEIEQTQPIQQPQQPTYSYLSNTDLFRINDTPVMQDGGNVGPISIKQAIEKFENGGRKVKVEVDGEIREVAIDSEEYKQMYDSGRLSSYNESTGTYSFTPMEELIIEVEAPEWVKYKREYEKNNPKRDFIESYLTPLAKSLGNSRTNYPERLDREYEDKALDYVAEQIVKNKPQGDMSRAEWLNTLSEREEEIVKRNPKYQSSLWADTKRGLMSFTEENAFMAGQNIGASPDYSRREKLEMLKSYDDHPIMSKLGDAAKTLSPITVGSKALQSIYRDDTTLTGALRGEKNNASFAEDAIFDFTNLLGVGVGKNVAKGLGKATIKSIDDLGSKYLPNAHKSNPFAFKPDPDAYYRMIGKDGYKDAIESGVIRKPKDSRYSVTSFAEGKVLDNEYKGPYMVQAKDKAHFKPDFPGEVATRYDIPIDSPDITMYKQDWLKGYKEVPKNKVLNKTDDVVKTATSSVDDVGKGFKSEIQYGIDGTPDMDYKTFKNLNNQEKLKFIENVDNTIQKNGERMLSELTSPEGKRRLTQQFKEMYPDYTTEELDQLVTNRINSVGYSIIDNRADWVKSWYNKKKVEEGIDAAGAFLETIELDYYFPYKNAHYGHETLFNRDHSHLMKDINLTKSANKGDNGITLTNKSRDPFDPEPGYITLGKGYENSIETLSHEAGHAIQKGQKLPIDDELRNLINSLVLGKGSITKGLRDDIWRTFFSKSKNPIRLINNLDYFVSGSKGKEPYPFARELRENMLQKGQISDVFEDITASKLTSFKNTEKGITGNNRLLYMIPPWDRKKLAKTLNKAPVIIPPAIGIGTATQSQQKQQGLNKEES